MLEAATSVNFARRVLSSATSSSFDMSLLGAVGTVADFLVSGGATDAAAQVDVASRGQETA